MKPRIFSQTFVLVGLILFSRSVYAADFCVTPDFASAFGYAEVIFSGEITSVERVQSSTAEADEYVVTFSVETWWKGKRLRAKCVCYGGQEWWDALGSQ